MIKHVLIGRTEDDWKVKYPCAWAEIVIKHASKKGINVLDLKNEEYTRVNVENSINTHKPFFVFCNGHGEEYSTRGYKEEVIIQVGLNEHILKNRIVYFLSCKCGTVLGRRLIDIGCNSFIGYKEEFAYPTNDLDTPLEDDAARGFMEASNEVAISILNGNSAEQAWKNSQAKFDEWIEIWRKQGSTRNISLIIGALRRSKKIQIYLSG